MIAFAYRDLLTHSLAAKLLISDNAHGDYQIAADKMIWLN